MTSRSSGHHRISSQEMISDKTLLSSSRRKKHQNSQPEQKQNSDPIPPFVFTSPLTSSRPPFSTMQNGECSIFRRQPSKLLVNVSMENSPGAMQVVMIADETVADLVKAALVFYKREKRRPFLKDTDPKHYDLHYSSFVLQSLEGEEKLMNLGSRNFYLCSKPPPPPRPPQPNSTSYSCSEKNKNMMALDSARPWMIFVHLLL